MRTLKYRPAFPERFASLEDARCFSQEFFAWYNGRAPPLRTWLSHPADVHFGRAGAVQIERARVLQAAYAAYPERFVRQLPLPPLLPGPAWINKPPEVTLAR